MRYLRAHRRVALIEVEFGNFDNKGIRIAAGNIVASDHYRLRGVGTYYQHMSKCRPSFSTNTGAKR